MLPKETGGPAFPTQTYEYDGQSRVLQYQEGGATLRDYFIAHAPSVAPPWFKPVMPACPAHKWVGSSGVEYESLAQATRDSTEDFTNINFDEQQEWHLECVRQVCFQWPAAWADAMLEARKS